MVRVKITAVNKFGTFHSLIQEATEREVEDLEYMLQKADRLDYFSMEVAPAEIDAEDLVKSTLIIPGSLMKDTMLFLTKAE
jgi:hypothetical protein